MIAFNVLGLAAIPLGAWRGWRSVRGYRWRAAHLASLVLVAAQALAGRACFLTIWEYSLMNPSGFPSAPEPLIAGWARRAVYWPLPLWAFAVLYAAACVAALALWRLVPPERSSPERMI